MTHSEVFPLNMGDLGIGPNIFNKALEQATRMRMREQESLIVKYLEQHPGLTVADCILVETYKYHRITWHIEHKPKKVVPISAPSQESDWTGAQDE